MNAPIHGMNGGYCERSADSTGQRLHREREPRAVVGARWEFGHDLAVGLEATRDDAGETSSSALQLRAALRF